MQFSPSTGNLTKEIRRHPVYDSIKDMVIRHELPVGKRILIEPLADQLFISNTPVREALIQLAAERIIKDIPKAGYFTKELSEAETRDIYILNQLMLDWSLSVTRNDGRVPGMLKPPDLVLEMETSAKPAIPTLFQTITALFVHIARQSGNGDVIHLVKNINDRTYYIRWKEFELFGDPDNDLLHLCQLYHQRDIDCLRSALCAYHQDRIERLPQLLRLLRGSLSRAG